jgi:metallophosphoesterase superfamily enzyme
MSTVLAIPDLHCPADHKQALRFVCSVASRVNPTHIVFLGDVIDHNAISFHEKMPELPSAKEEYRQMKLRLKRWYREFPNAKVCIGNHDERVHRVVRRCGVPSSIYLREYNDVLELGDGWKWGYSHTIDKVLYTHGHGSSTAWSIAKNTNKSTVCGHIHTACELKFMATDEMRFFGMNVGSLVDRHHPAMEYAKADIVKPILAVGVIRNGNPTLELMNL